MMIVLMGLDQHRGQIRAEWLDTETGELSRHRSRPADRGSFRRFLSRFEGRRVEATLEATTGWRFLVEELERAGHVAHLAEPAETAALRGPKRRAKSDRADARQLRELLAQGRLPESWIPPEHILELRSKVRLRPGQAAHPGGSTTTALRSGAPCSRARAAPGLRASGFPRRRAPRSRWRHR